MGDNSKKVTKTIEHPLEEFFEIEQGSTEVEVYKHEGELVTAEGYDDKDSEIEQQYQEVYDSAMDGYEALADELQVVEGKYKARVGEVSVQHLNTALNAASLKARLKEHKDKLEAKAKAGPSNVTNNNTLIVDDRSAMLEQLRKGMEEDKKKKADNEE